MKRALCCLVFFFAAMLVSAERTIRIQWSPVVGARGYAVQWERSDEPAQKTEAVARKGDAVVQATFVDLRLNPGVYKMRVSALNRFGKPAEWSDWIEFRIEDTTRAQTVDLNRAGEENKKKAEMEQKKPPPSPVPPKSWHVYVPGLTQIESGRPYGWAYPVAMVGLSLYAASEKRKGDLLAKDRWNNPDFFLPVSLKWSLESKLLLWTRRSEQRERYDRAQQNQRIAGYGLLLLFGLHSFEMARWNSGRSSVLVGSDGLAVQVRF